MLIRDSSKKDLAEVFNLVKKMIDYHRGLDEYYKSANEFKNLKSHVAGWLKEKDTKVLVAESDGGIIGYLRAGIEKAPDYVKTKKIGQVFDVFVEAPYRRQGIASMLFSKAEEWFQSRGISNIELNVDARNESAIDLWRRLKFFEYKIRMRKKL